MIARLRASCWESLREYGKYLASAQRAFFKPWKTTYFLAPPSQMPLFANANNWAPATATTRKTIYTFLRVVAPQHQDFGSFWGRVTATTRKTVYTFLRVVAVTLCTKTTVKRHELSRHIMFVFLVLTYNWIIDNAFDILYPCARAKKLTRNTRSDTEITAHPYTKKRRNNSNNHWLTKLDWSVPSTYSVYAFHHASTCVTIFNTCLPFLLCVSVPADA